MGTKHQFLHPSCRCDCYVVKSIVGIEEIQLEGEAAVTCGKIGVCLSDIEYVFATHTIADPLLNCTRRSPQALYKQYMPIIVVVLVVIIILILRFTLL